MMTITKRIILVISVLIFCVSCDQATKAVAETYLSKSESWSFLGDTFRLQLAHNTGAFLGLGGALPEAWREIVFSIGTAGLLLLLLGFILFSKSVTRLETFAYVLLLAGGVGNLIDRVRYGYVIDFMNMGLGFVRTGIFNIADIVVTVGFIILLFHARVAEDVKNN